MGQTCKRGRWPRAHDRPKRIGRASSRQRVKLYIIAKYLTPEVLFESFRDFFASDNRVEEGNIAHPAAFRFHSQHKVPPPHELGRQHTIPAPQTELPKKSPKALIDLRGCNRKRRTSYFTRS